MAKPWYFKYFIYTRNAITILLFIHIAKWNPILVLALLPCVYIHWAVVVRNKLWFGIFFCNNCQCCKNKHLQHFCCKKFWLFWNVANWNVANFSRIKKLLQTSMLQTFWANLHCCQRQLLQQKKPMPLPLTPPPILRGLAPSGLTPRPNRGFGLPRV